MVNMEKVVAVLNWIQEHEAQWEQRSFALPVYKKEDREVDICHSTYCMAGATLLLEHRVTFVGEHLVPTYPDGSTDEYADWEEMAQEILGLNSDQSFCIFYAMTDDFDDFKEHVLWVIEHPDDIYEMHDRKDSLSDLD